MENLSRNLEKDIVKYTFPSQTKRQRRWKLLFIGDDGRVFPILWFKAAAIVLIFISCAGFCTSGLFFYLYRISNQKVIQLQLTLEKMGHPLNTSQTNHIPHPATYPAAKKAGKDKLNSTQTETKPKAKQISQSKKPPENKTEKTPSVSAARTKPAKKKITPLSSVSPSINPSAKPSAPTAQETTSPKSESSKQKVNVTALVVSQRLSREIVRFKFVVRNESRDQTTISGYVFLILKYKGAKEQEWITIPSVSLVSGKPYLIKSGQYFKISNYKTVTFKIKQPSDLHKYDQATVIIYDENQRPMFEKHFPIAIKALEKHDNVAETDGKKKDTDDKTKDKELPKNDIKQMPATLPANQPHQSYSQAQFDSEEKILSAPLPSDKSQIKKQSMTSINTTVNKPPSSAKPLSVNNGKSVLPLPTGPQKGQSITKQPDPAATMIPKNN